MIDVVEFAYEIDRALNKLSTNANQQIPVEDKVLAINNAQIKLIINKIGTANPYKLGLDGFKKRYQDLQFLCENPEDHPLTLKLKDKFLYKWVTNIEELSPKFMFYLDSYMVADKGSCKDRVIYCNGDLIKHTDITTLLQNNNYKPSFEYQETFVDISVDELHYYTDGTFSPKKVYLSYVRYPKKADLEGYIDFDGKESSNQNIEFEYYLKSELLNLVVQELSSYTNNEPALRDSKLREQDSE